MADVRVSSGDGWTRRAWLRLAGALGLAPSTTLLAARPPEKQRPQIGDRLVHAFGAEQHQPIRASTLIPGAPPIAAWPMEPASAIVRDGSRLNHLMVMKIDPARLTERTQPHAANGVMAYSAVCTHTGCAVENWNDDAERLVCVCHESEFDVADAARVVAGPAPKPLAMLPLALDGEFLTVTGKFSRRVGAEPQG